MGRALVPPCAPMGRALVAWSLTAPLWVFVGQTLMGPPALPWAFLGLPLWALLGPHVPGPYGPGPQALRHSSEEGIPWQWYEHPSPHPGLLIGRGTFLVS